MCLKGKDIMKKKKERIEFEGGEEKEKGWKEGIIILEERRTAKVHRCLFVMGNIFGLKIGSRGPLNRP